MFLKLWRRSRYGNEAMFVRCVLLILSSCTCWEPVGTGLLPTSRLFPEHPGYRFKGFSITKTPAIAFFSIRG